MHTPMRRPLALSIPARLVLVVLVLSACALAPGAFRRVTPAPYYLPDTPASALDVIVSIGVGGNSLSSLGSVGAFVNVSFSVPRHLVAFRDGETLTCDGSAPLLLSSIAYVEEHPFSPPGLGRAIPSPAPIPQRDGLLALRR